MILFKIWLAYLINLGFFFLFAACKFPTALMSIQSLTFCLYVSRCSFLLHPLGHSRLARLSWPLTAPRPCAHTKSQLTPWVSTHLQLLLISASAMPRTPPPNSSDYKFITRLWKFNETKLIVSCNEYALTAAAQMETDHLTKSARNIGLLSWHII